MNNRIGGRLSKMNDFLKLLSAVLKLIYHGAADPAAHRPLLKIQVFHDSTNRVQHHYAYAYYKISYTNWHQFKAASVLLHKPFFVI